MQVKYLDLIDYSEIFMIVEKRDGAVYKTKSLGFIKTEEAKQIQQLFPDTYTMASLSTKILDAGLKHGHVELRGFFLPIGE